MPGDPSGRNDEELLSQLDDLRARMDRLMKGGTSTSNSALLTDPPKDAAQTVKPQPSPEPPPERTRVRDLIGPTDHEVVEAYSGGEDAVAFPDERPDDKDSQGSRPQEERPVNKPRSATVDGSLISVNGTLRREPRRQVKSFDDIGSALEEELARDASVPPVESRKGPDLASRFGTADEPVPTVGEVEQENVEAELPEEPDEDLVEVEVEVEDEDEEGLVLPALARSRRGALVAIWGFTGVTGGTIAILHFAGVL
jgi:hypothetical protein